MRFPIVIAVACGVLGGVAGCGEDAADEPVELPRSGTAYRALSGTERLAVAAGCRDRAAATGSGVAASEVRKIDPEALREQLDFAYRFIADQRRPVKELCRERLPFVTPGLRVSFDAAEQFGDDRFTYETDSDIPLRIRGAVSPAPRGGKVAVRRDLARARTYTGKIGADGRFALPAIRLRKIADNSFVVAVHAPPSALRKMYFSAICLDCLAGAPPPSAEQ